MAVPNTLQGNPHSDRPIGWRGYRFAAGVLTAGEVNFTLATLPAGTIIIDATIICEIAQAGGTSMTVDIEVGATGIGDTNLLTGVVGVIGTTENTVTEANLTTINAVSLGGAPLIVNAEMITVGTITTRPFFQLYINYGRFAY